MKVGIIQASSQKEKNSLLYESTKQYAKDCDVINFGCDDSDKSSYSYIEISIEIGFLLASGSVDFIVTGCSSGQGMMLACNSIPGVICGYAPTPKDAYLFAQINNGNAISLPLGEEYTYTGRENLERTVELLFSEPFGQGYPKEEADRKIKDTKLLKEIRANSQNDLIQLMKKLDKSFVQKILEKRNVIDYILGNGTNNEITDWIKSNLCR